MNEYRVNLDIYNGPLDLLLYLIRRDELDIYDIPISRVTEQYVKYVELLQQVDPNLAGEFLVTAASLMEIKTRMLLPTPSPEEGAADGSAGLDPRAELVRQLLQYKAFKDAAADLNEAARLRAMKFERHVAVPGMEGVEYDLDDVQVWDLLDAFSKLMASIGAQPREHQVIYDDTPVELHAADIMDRLAREGAMTFSRIFEGRTNRGEIVGLFLALLELVRQKKILAVQDTIFGEISIVPRPDALDDKPAGFADAAGAQAPAGADEAQSEEPPAEPVLLEADAPQAAEGRYVSDRPNDEEPADIGDAAAEPPPGEEDDDEHSGETQGSGT